MQLNIDDSYEKVDENWYKKWWGWAAHIASIYGRLGYTAVNTKDNVMIEAFCYLRKEPVGEALELFKEESHNRLMVRMTSYNIWTYNREAEKCT